MRISDWSSDVCSSDLVEYELFIVVDRADLWVDPWEGVQRTHRLDAADARNVVEQFPGAVALLQQPALWQDQVIDALVAAQRCLDRVLARYVGTQAHVGQDRKSTRLNSSH